MKSRSHTSVRALCQCATVAALYVLLTYLSTLLGLSSMVPQCRLSESLCILPFFFPATVPGLALGCLLANLLSNCILPDVLLGTLATLAGAIGCRILGVLFSHKANAFSLLLSTLPNTLANTFIIPLVLRYAYHLEGSYALLSVSVLLGELISGTLFGTGLGLALRKVFPHVAASHKI